MSIKCIWSFLVVGIVASFTLAACNQAKQVSDTIALSATETPEPTVLHIPQVLSENGYPVGIQVDANTQLRFLPPTAKLYTDSLAFQTALQAGLNGVLISLTPPVWISRCTFEADKEFAECFLDSRKAYVRKEIESYREVWIAAPVDHQNVQEELQNLSGSIRFEFAE